MDLRIYIVVPSVSEVDKILILDMSHLLTFGRRSKLPFCPNLFEMSFGPEKTPAFLDDVQ